MCLQHIHIAYEKHVSAAHLSGGDGAFKASARLYAIQRAACHEQQAIKHKDARELMAGACVCTCTRVRI